MKTLLLNSTRALPRRFWAALALPCAILGLCVYHASADGADLTQYKLFGHWASGAALPYATYYMGSAAALGEKWAVVGAYAAKDKDTVHGQGAVQVYDAVGGVWKRELLPPVADTAFADFGWSVAVSADVAVVGARNVGNGKGAAYVYNLSTGALLWTLKASDGAQQDLFGSAVALSGKRVLVGAPQATSNGKAEGAVYVFDLTTGAQLARLELGAAGAAQDLFGSAIAAEGTLAIIGAPGYSANNGGVFLYDLETLPIKQVFTFTLGGAMAGSKLGTSVALAGTNAYAGAPFYKSNQGAVVSISKANISYQTLTASDGAAGDFLGGSVSADAGVVVAGAKNVNASGGKVYVFDAAAGGNEVGSVTAADATTGSGFGTAVSICGNSVLVGNSSDATQGSFVGAAYLVRPVTTTVPDMVKVAGKGEFAPRTPDTTFGTLGDAFVTSAGDATFQATLAGAGSHGGKDTGVWTTMRNSLHTLDLSFVSRPKDALGNAAVLSVGPPLTNASKAVLSIITLQTGPDALGTPITAANNKRLMFDPGVIAPLIVQQTGTPVVDLGNAKVATFGETVQSSASGNRFGMAVTFTASATSTPKTTSLNDSGVMIYLTDLAGGVREGDAVTLTNPADPLGLAVPGHYGQFTGRVAYPYGTVVYSAATVAVTSPKIAAGQVIAQTIPGNNPVVLAQTSLLAPDSGGATFASFLGETAGGAADNVLIRATLAGTGVTTATNEGLWRNASGVLFLTLRKGPLAGYTDLSIVKFISSWAGGSNKVMALVQLGGKGVTAANDQALVLAQEDGTNVILMREGDTAPGCHGATIGTISRVDADPTVGAYAALVTLGGAAPATEQALYFGHSNRGNSTTTRTMRRPNLVLRKGWLFDNQPGKIKSMSLPAGSITAGGIGGTGRSRAVSQTGLAVTIEFDNGVRQVMAGYVP